MKLEQVLPALRNGGKISNDIFTSKPTDPKPDQKPILNAYLALQEVEFNDDTKQSLVQVNSSANISTFHFGNLSTDILLGDGWFLVSESKTKKGK
jgi:hypothetical protein